MQTSARPCNARPITRNEQVGDSGPPARVEVDYGTRHQLALDAALAKAKRDLIRSERLWEASHLDDEPSRGSVE